METIFLVNRVSWYDHSISPVRAFRNKEKAESFSIQKRQKELIACKGIANLANIFEVEPIEFEDGD